MNEEAIMGDWIPDESECQVLARGDSARPARILIVAQPKAIVDALELEFARRGWISLIVNDVGIANEILCRVPTSAAVLPLDASEVLDGSFCSAVRSCPSSRHLPLVAFGPGAGPPRLDAWRAGVDAFVPHSAGASGVCRELTALLAIAADVESEHRG